MSGAKDNRGKLKKRMERMAEAKARRTSSLESRIIDLCLAFQSFRKADAETQGLVIGLVVQAWNYAIVIPDTWQAMLREVAEAEGATDSLDLLLRDMGETARLKTERYPTDNRYVVGFELVRPGKDVSLRLEALDLGETVSGALKAEVAGHLRDELVVSFRARREQGEALAAGAAGEAAEDGAPQAQAEVPSAEPA